MGEAMNLLADLYSTIDSKKRQLKGLLSDPVETIRQGLLNFRDDQSKLLNDFGVGYQTPGYKSVLATPEQVKAAQQSVADWGANQGIGAATVWHGSPHKFNKFDSSKIGTGEGGQSFGYGLYLAELPGVADTYARTVSGQKIRDSVGYQAASDRNATSSAIDYFTAMKQGKAPRDVVNGKLVDNAYIEKQLSGLRKELASHDAALGQSPQLYKVDLPDEAIAKMLDWDKPLSQQPAFDSLQQLARKRAIADATYQATEAARTQLPKRPINEADWINALFSGASQADDALLKELTQKEMAKLDIAALTEKQLQSMKHPSQTWEMLGKNFYEALSNSTDAKRASDLLKSQGIPGIKYWDGGSRGAGQGTSNYVIFPGNESLLTILERNGQPVGLLD